MPYDAQQAEDAAALLVTSRLAHTFFERLPEACRPRTEDDAYLVQDAVHAKLTAAGGGAFTGHKIGCTTRVMQEYLGVANPCAGGVREETVRRLEGTFAQSELLRIGVECELAVVLGEDLDLASAELGRDRVGRAVGSVAAAIEVVEDRYADYPSLDTPTLVADDFFGAGCVLGEPREDWPELDLAAVEGSMSINGRHVGSGIGTDILGHPLEALRWLAIARAARGQPLRAGEFVLLGSLVQTNWVRAGDTVVVESPQLGTVTARFV